MGQHYHNPRDRSRRTTMSRTAHFRPELEEATCADRKARDHPNSELDKPHTCRSAQDAVDASNGANGGSASRVVLLGRGHGELHRHAAKER